MVAALGRAGVVLVVAAIAGSVLGCQGPASSAVTSPGSGEPVETVDDQGPHAYPDLEAGLPRQIAGIALETSSLPGASDDGSATDAGGQLFATAIRDLGRKPADLQLAIARPANGDSDIVVVGYRLPGVTGAHLLGSLGPADVDGSIEPATIAGKDVLALLEIGATSYAYAADEVVYVVGGAPGLIRAAIEALP